MAGSGMGKATAIGGLAILLWSLLALLTTATRGIPPFELLALSFAIASACGLAVVVLRGASGLGRLRAPLPAWGLGFAGLFLYHSLYFAALKQAPAAEASLIAYLWPLLIVLFSAALPGQHFRPRHLAGAGLGLAGTALLLHGGAGPAEGSRALGDACALGCALVWTGYSVLNRRFAGTPTESVAGICAAVAAAGLACHLVLERWTAPHPGQWAAIALLGAGPVGLAFFAWDFATKRGDLALLGTLSYGAPLLSTLLLVATGRAQATPGLFLAAILVIAGAALAAGRLPRRR
jgi:drug/metabolite transporter (DMT)-like permease